MTSVYVGLAGEAPAAGFEISLNIGEHIYTGAAEFQQKFGSPTTLETDLLNIAAIAQTRDMP